MRVLAAGDWHQPMGDCSTRNSPLRKLGRRVLQIPQPEAGVFKSQAKLVLVDSVVTDKQGNYIRDLTQKDFRVWEDNKEQAIKSFSYESEETSASKQTKHYLVLFFDNSTMDFSEQAQ